MSTSRAMRGGWVDRKAIPRGPNGRGLCRWCSLEVPRGRYTFCSEFCVHEWKLRTQPAYLREQVLHRDRGIRACCGVDAIAEARRLRYARGTNRAALLARWGLRRHSRKSLWDADHIIPVIEGGGDAISRISNALPALPSQRHCAFTQAKMRVNPAIAIKVAVSETLPS